MIDVYNNYKDNQEILDDLKILFATIEAGKNEERKIKEEYAESKKLQYDGMFYYPDLGQFLLSCVAGGIIYRDEEDGISRDGLHPYNLYGYRIRSLIMALKILNSVGIIRETFNDELWLHEDNNNKASQILNMIEKNTN